MQDELAINCHSSWTEVKHRRKQSINVYLGLLLKKQKYVAENREAEHT